MFPMSSTLLSGSIHDRGGGVGRHPRQLGNVRAIQKGCIPLLIYPRVVEIELSACHGRQNPDRQEARANHSTLKKVEV